MVEHYTGGGGGAWMYSAHAWQMGGPDVDQRDRNCRSSPPSKWSFTTPEQFNTPKQNTPMCDAAIPVGAVTATAAANLKTWIGQSEHT